MYSSMSGLARMPTSRPPHKPAIPCVENTPSVSSTLIMKPVFWNLFIESHGMMPATRPMMMAPHPLTKPAPGVIATKPAIMPLIAPMIEGLPYGHLVHQRPDEEAYCSGRVGVGHGRARVVIGKIRIAAIETVPT